MTDFEEAKRAFTDAYLTPALGLMREANNAVAAAERRAIKAEATMEALRPVWAQGWSDDSVTAQASACALSELWELLGASNQTQAVQKLRFLLERT